MSDVRSKEAAIERQKARDARMNRPFQQGMKWCCHACWRDRGVLEPLGPRGCVCGYERDKGLIEFKDAFSMALRACKEGRTDFAESCTFCEDEPRNHGHTLCMSCGRESAWKWEVDVMKYFEDVTADLSKVYPDADTCEKLSR